MAELQFEGLSTNNGYYNTTIVNGSEGLLPPGGKPGEVLVKSSWNDYDAVWATAYVDVDGGGSGGTGTGGDIVLDSIAPIRVSGGGSAWTISIDSASQTRPGSMSAADKRRLDNLPCWVSATAPTQARTNDFWFDTTLGRLFILHSDGSSTQWIDASPDGSGGGGTKEVYSGSVPPVGVAPDTIWFNSSDGVGYLLFDDGNSQQWVPLAPQGGGSGQGIYFGDLPPDDPTAWAGWFDTTLGITFLWYDDGDSAQWIPATPQGSGQNGELDELFYS